MLCSLGRASLDKLNGFHTNVCLMGFISVADTTLLHRMSRKAAWREPAWDDEPKCESLRVNASQ